MTQNTMNTAELHGWLDRLKAGDEQALDELFRRAGARLERIARTMLQRFPRVARWADVEDVVQRATRHWEYVMRATATN